MLTLIGCEYGCYEWYKIPQKNLIEVSIGERLILWIQSLLLEDTMISDEIKVFEL
jgi:hypothetical protein